MKFTVRSAILLLAAFVAGAAAFGLLWLRLERRLQTELTAQEAQWYPSVWRESAPVGPERGIRLWLADGPVCAAARFGTRQFYGGGMGLLVRDGDGSPLRRLTVLDGLPVERVESLAVLGSRLYIGTGGGGLARWDGRRFETFSLPVLADAWVTALAETSAGTLLAATRQGYLLELGADSFRFIPTPGVPAGGLSRVLPSGRGFFLGTFGHGLYFGENGRCRPLLARQHPCRMVTDLARLPGGQVLAGTDAGLFVLSARGDFQEHLFADRMVTMAGAAGDQVLCACLEDGLYHASLAGWTGGRRAFHRFGIPDAVQGAAVMPGGTEILTSRGVYRLDPGARPDQFRLEPLRLPPGELARPSVMTLAGDGRGGLWLGYFDGGVEERAADGSRRRVLTPPDLVCVNHLAFQGGVLWAGTARGAYVCRPGGCAPAGTPESPLRSAYINQIVPLPGGAWGIAHGEGFSILSGGGERLLYVRDGLPSNKIYCAAQRGATLYLGTLGGLAVLERDRVAAVFQADNSRLRVNWITALLPCAQGLVVGTYGGGAQLLGPTGAWDEFSGVDRRLGINPNALCAAGSRILAGSLARGVWLLDPASRSGRHLDLPLPARSVQAILLDGQTLYVSTENGVMAAPLATVNLELEKTL